MREKEVARMRIIVKELNKILQSTDKSIYDADNDLNILAIEIERVFTEKKLRTPIKSLGVKVEIKDPKESKFYSNLLKAIEGETIAQGIQLLQGLSSQIRNTIKKRNQKTKFKTIKLDLL